MKNKTIPQHIRRVHLHAGLLIAIAALLLTSFKSSEEMLRVLRAVPVSSTSFEDVRVREAETDHAPVIVSLSRHAVVAGK